MEMDAFPIVMVLDATITSPTFIDTLAIPVVKPAAKIALLSEDDTNDKEPLQTHVKPTGGGLTTLNVIVEFSQV